MFSKVVRQTHMYVGLVLMPWILMYGLSTLVMNHRPFFKELYGGPLVKWIKEKEQPCNCQFSPRIPPRVAAEEILRNLGLTGDFYANWGKLPDGPRLTIMRTDAITPRQIFYTVSDGKLRVEKQEFRSQPFLERLHRRRGYRSSQPGLDTAWAVSVDLAIAGMLFWIASGVWMWWELKVTRRIGCYCILGGAALFALFVVVL
ncbi:MAG: hypothetical protein NTY38_19310 [Acidobacteria bacterium]|nr:hypothetical protein [Acidobacteriota bacterium]